MNVTAVYPSPYQAAIDATDEFDEEGGTARDGYHGGGQIARQNAGSIGDGARTLAPGRFEYPPDPALIEKGHAHVESLKAAGLSEGRAAEIVADEPFLQKIGILLERGGEGESAGSDRARRAIEVLVTDFGTSAGAADRYVSDLALSGAISLDEFVGIAGDGDFLGKLLPLLDAAAEHPTSAGADREMLLRLAGDGIEATIDENGLSIVSGETAERRDSTVGSHSPNSVDHPGALDADARTTAYNVTAAGEPFPDELQQRLDAVTTGGGQPDPLLGRVAAILGGAPSSPTEQFLAQAYLGRNITLDDFIGRLDDAEFMEAETTAFAAETLLGLGQDHEPGDDFMNTIFADGHIDLDTYIAEVNDEGKMKDLDAAVRLGEVHYENAVYGELDALIDGLDLSVDGMKAILHPGANLAEGPPSPEQIAVFHHLAGGRNQKFVELISMWLIENNPGYAIRFGHPTEEAKAAGEPRRFFWTDNDRQVDDPFLNSLLGGLDAGDRSIADLVPPVSFLHPDENVLMHEVRFTFKATNDHGDGSSRDHDHDDETDHTRWLDDILFPEGELEDRLQAHGEAGHVPVVLDSVYAERDGIGDASRAAFGAIDPALVEGVKISWIKDKDGVPLQNASRLEKSVLYVENSKNINFRGNGGPVEAETFASENVTLTTDEGPLPPPEESDEPLIADTANTGAFRLGPDSDVAFLDGRVSDHLNNPATLQLIRSFAAGADPVAAVLASERSPFTGLAPEEKSYVYFELVEGFAARTAEPSGAGQQDTTSGTGHDTASGDVGNTAVQGIDPERQADIESYTAFLVDEAFDAVRRGEMTPEAAFDFVHGEVELSRATEGNTGADSIALTDAELAHAHAHADELMLVSTEAHVDGRTGGEASDVSNATAGGETTEGGTPSISARRQETLGDIASLLHEDIGSDNAYEAVFGDERFAGYPEHERAYIVVEVERLQSGGEDEREGESGADIGGESDASSVTEASNGVWDEYAISAKRQFTETVDGVERFNQSEFNRVLELDRERLERDEDVGAEGVEYIRYQTLVFAYNGGVLDLEDISPADRAVAGLPDPEDDPAHA